MACGLLLQPAGAATAAALWPCLLLLPAPSRSFPNKEQLNRVLCMNRFYWNPTLSATKSHRSRTLVGRSSSGSSAEVAEVRRPADVSTTQSNLSMSHCMDLVPGALIVISGYWTGPDVDDGGGSVEAMLQRIV
ncbi:hypothetical protein BAE44_0024783 [Dichanthelium oligosanthes]|uniref:Uncharacterized protein n=1 Tax=Dichanthelium oligosanthes TaxID=888268 RepID=A0A1E5UMU4_9POAL|nr:hypothetical protein BAE44_0024783 [Dichanthelium oligosanthes]